MIVDAAPPRSYDARVSDQAPTPALVFRGVSKSFPTGDGEAREIFRDLDLTVPAGRKLAIIGRSGSGKSTLLHLAAGIERPTSGEILAGGRSLGQMGEAERTRYRRETVGLVFQFFHLLPWLSVADNVALPELIAGGRPRDYRPRVGELLSRVGLADRADDAAQKLSGGEMQRVAICRALMPGPPILLADEPTGNLDDDTSAVVIDLLVGLAREEGSTLILVTHSPEIAAMADEVRRLHGGMLEPA